MMEVVLKYQLKGVIRFYQNTLMKPFAILRKNILGYCLLSFLPLLGCDNSKTTDKEILKFLNESIESSSIELARSDEQLYLTMEQNKTFPSAEKKSKIMYEAAGRIKMFSRACIKYIEGLKELLREKEVNQFFVVEEKGKELYNTLTTYRHDVLSADTLIEKKFSDSFVLASILFDSSKNNDFTNIFFRNASKEHAMAILNKLQNNIYVNEHRLLSFLNRRIVYDFLYPENYTSAFIMQNSSCVLPGQFIEITAGAGLISFQIKPQVKIRNRNVPIGNDGLAISKFRVPNKPGKYATPVEISFCDQDGISQTINREIQYTVFDTTAIK